MDEVFEFLSNTDPKLCVIATTFNDIPECAVMGYSVNKDLSLVFSTDNTSRKFKNILNNPKIAINFGWSFSTLNVQYEGNVSVVNRKNEQFKFCENTYISSHPESVEFKDLPETVYLVVKPFWIKINDYLTNPPRFDILELSK